MGLLESQRPLVVIVPHKNCTVTKKQKGLEFKLYNHTRFMIKAGVDSRVVQPRCFLNAFWAKRLCVSSTITDESSAYLGILILAVPYTQRFNHLKHDQPRGIEFDM